MKKLFVLLLPILLLAACGEDSVEDKAANRHELISEFSPIIQGTWVLTDYIDALEKTKSPMEASAMLTGPVFMRIDPSEITGDTIYVASSMNNHEGYTFYLFMQQGADKQSLKTDHMDESGQGSYELSYEINDDTTLFLRKYNDDKKLVSSRSFTKVTGPQGADSQPYGVAYMANKVLFAGEYTIRDEITGETKEIELTPDGFVEGMETHHTYYVFTDFMEEVETNLDEMLFDEHTRNQKGYIFDIEGDTIMLFKAMENEERTLLIKGPLTYTLVRK